MEQAELVKLTLLAPILYTADERIDPWSQGVMESREERLFCFEIPGPEAFSIEPLEDHFLGPLLFAGRLLKIGEDPEPGKLLELPAGKYFFSQRRRALNREDFILAAMENQKDGLWERLRPKKLLYLRRLFEDHSPVTQVLRPYQ
jgi:hypothetical protein